MPVITSSAEKADRAQFDSPQQPEISASTCPTHFFYNIPPGVITVALPGLSIFVTGVVLIGLTSSAAEPSSVAEGLSRNAVVIVTVGGCWTALVIGFWVITYCRYRKPDTIRQHHKSSMSSVELVSVSRRDDEQHYCSFHVSRDQIR